MARRRGGYGSYTPWGDYHYTSVAEMQANANKTLAKHKDYEPVRVTAGTRKICTSWWGDAWCRNLERYADWANRIERGRRYVRNGAVLDLKIAGGTIRAKVQGSRATPYEVEITVAPLSEKRSKEIEAQAAGKIEDLESLASGKFPDELKEMFFQEDGLFPSPKEIKLNCSCPDWAIMCKHVAAVLYGIGVRLDSNPMYFFQMRGIDIESFIGKVVGGKVETMLAHANKKSPRIMKDADLMALFGV